MKTIVINTSKEAKKTNLDILFNAPFDRNCLLRYECGLDTIDETAEQIKHSLITDVDTVDRDYNLIVLVDLYELPSGNEVHAAEMYKLLINHYIGATLVNRLHNEFNLLPNHTAVFYANSAKIIKDLDLESLDSNTKEQEKKEIEAYQKAAKLNKSRNATEDLVEEDILLTEDTDSKKLSRAPEDRLIMELFSWNESIGKSDFNWKIKLSIADNTYLDFSKVFSDISYSIEKSDESAAVLEFALKELKKILVCNGKIESSATQSVPLLNNYSITSHTCKFERDNEQNLKEGFFKLYANVFTCVQSGTIISKIKDFNKDEIKTLLLNALNKYNYFSKEENIKLELEPIGPVFENRKSIFKKHKEDALAKSSFKNMSDEKIAEQIMESSKNKKSTPSFNSKKMHGADLKFFNIVDEIFDNYDAEIIKNQNELIVKNCMVNLWDWRDRCTNDDFRRTVKTIVNSQTESSEEKDLSCDSVSFYAEKNEQEYNRLVTEITEVEHRISANKNILLDTKNIIIRYNDLIRKGKNYLISFIGAILAVISSVVPFIYIQFYTTEKTAVSVIMYLLFTAGFALLYAVASGLYMTVIGKKKLALKTELEDLKEKSQNDRKESIMALYRYYSNTIVEANCHYLLWNELLRREEENGKKGIMRNAHITHLNELKNVVNRYITMLKIHDTDEITADESYKKLYLIGHEPFYSDNNKKIYSILSESGNDFKSEEGGK